LIIKVYEWKVTLIPIIFA